MDERPEVVLVQGDTNTVLAGALAASKLHIKVGQVEAGLRSYDRSMPEEINRVVADHISDYLFAPTENSRENLRKEGIAEEKIHVTGNTIVDSVYQNLEIARRKVNVLEDLGLAPKEYFLVTAHRQENVDSRERLGEIIKGLELVSREFSLPVVFPVHPRTRKMAAEFGFEFDGIRAIEPLEESVRRWDCWAENYSDPGKLVQAKRNGKRIACRLPARLTDKPLVSRLRLTSPA